MENTLSTTEAHEESFSMGVDSRKMGIWVLIATEAVFFSGLIITYLVNRGQSTSGPLPQNTLDIPLTGVNTFLLLTSSLTMVLSLNAAHQKQIHASRLWLIGTVVLGLGFLTGQAFEFTHLYSIGATLNSNLFGATFFTLTGFHGAHVTAGVVWILFVLTRLFRRVPDPEIPLKIEMVGLYWHFVDLIWIIIFTLVYLL
jgi:heme/copper-type cytochrome/quinol oxidase subunit 3